MSDNRCPVCNGPTWDINQFCFPACKRHAVNESRTLAAGIASGYLDGPLTSDDITRMTARRDVLQDALSNVAYSDVTYRIDDGPYMVSSSPLSPFETEPSRLPRYGEQF